MVSSVRERQAWLKASPTHRSVPHQAAVFQIPPLSGTSLHLFLLCVILATPFNGILVIRCSADTEAPLSEGGGDD